MKLKKEKRKSQKGHPKIHLVHKKIVTDGKKKRLIILIILCVLVIVSSGYFFLTKDNQPLLGFEPKAVAYKSTIRKPEVWSSEQIAFPAFKQVKVKKGAKKIYIALANPAFNTANIKFTVYIDKRKQAVLTTGLVKPGEAVTEIPIPKKLSVGKHEMFLKMRGYATTNEESALSGTETSFNLIVLK